VHGVSRSVVREAVHQLRSRGLVLSRQGSGMFVAVRTEQQPLAFDPLVLQSIESVLQVVEVRRALEGEMAALAAQRATRTQITAMRRALKAIDTAMHSGADGVAEDLAFHRSMASATGNPQFTRLLSFLEQYLLDAMRVTKGNEARSAEFMAQVNAEHHALLDAIAARDEAAARAAAVAHLLRGERRLHEGGLIAAPVRHVKRVVRKAAPARSAK
jgi:GntR family transcriptional regulator, transcriptional repressor for pyruvate dehydrogenase complex